jgi:hypothetical protein
LDLLWKTRIGPGGAVPALGGGKAEAVLGAYVSLSLFSME